MIQATLVDRSDAVIGTIACDTEAITPDSAREFYETTKALRDAAQAVVDHITPLIAQQ